MGNSIGVAGWIVDVISLCDALASFSHIILCVQTPGILLSPRIKKGIEHEKSIGNRHHGTRWRLSD
jgi:hypothetical protein